MNQPLGDMFVSVAIFTAVVLVIFLIIRAFWLWYWKINKIVSELELLNNNVYKLGKMLQSRGVASGHKETESDPTRQEIKAQNITRLERLFDEREKITNDDVQEFLDVSDATATRYLEELERRGKIHQVGETGTAVHYNKNT